MLKLYENIKKLRKENDWSQEELAKRLGYTDRSSIAKIEAGLVDLSQSKIVEFAKVFNVSPGDLMGWEDSIVQYVNNSYELNDAYFSSSEEMNKAKKLYELYEKATPDVQQAVELILKSSQQKP